MSGEIKATPINEPSASLARWQGVAVMIDLCTNKYRGCSARSSFGEATRSRPMSYRFLKGRSKAYNLALTEEKRAKEVHGKEPRLRSKILEITLTTTSRRSRQQYRDIRGRAPEYHGRFPAAARSRGGDVDASLLEALRADGLLHGDGRRKQA